jgi:hypothetical protein
MTLARLYNESLKVSSQIYDLCGSPDPDLPRIGLADVERAYVHVDYENEHDIKEEHKPLYEITERRSIKQRVKSLLGMSKKQNEE